MNQMNTVLICENTLVGILTGVYAAYELKKDHETVKLQLAEQQELLLFSEYIEIKPVEDKAEKVIRTIRRDFGEETYRSICLALATEEKDKADAVYHGIVAGLKMKNKRDFLGNLGNAYILRIFELARMAGNETHHWLGFLRFQELENGILFSKIGAKSNILIFLAPHFQDRFPNENFMILDEIRNLCVVHPAGKEWILVSGDLIEKNMLGQYSGSEHDYQSLFQYFCDKIAIKERKNLKLQQQMLPLRYQEYMVEFQQNKQTAFS